jgi:archaemetzincin
VRNELIYPLLFLRVKIKTSVRTCRSLSVLIRVITLDKFDLGGIDQVVNRAVVPYNELVMVEHKRLELPFSDFNSSRNQYAADRIIREISRTTKIEEEEKLFILIAEDIYVAGLNFVFGLADPQRGVCIVSTARLKTPNLALFRERVFKETAHEVGHLFLLQHCQDRKCIMSFANSLEDVDFRGMALCQRCVGGIRKLEGLH